MYMRSNARAERRPIRPMLGALAAVLLMTGASAQTDLIVTEFNEDDQAGFDLWPVPLAGSLMTAQYGPITVCVSTNTSFASPVNRGSMDGNPPGYTYQHLYEDLLHAFTPTGTMTLDFSGLMPDADYTFTLYAWDPGSTGTHEWSVTDGTGVPPSITVDWSVPLVDNDTFALVFEVTTTSAGTFQVDNTAGLAGSAINGFKLRDSSGPIGTSYCGPANLNSTSQSAEISAVGVDQAGGLPLQLTATRLPADEFGYFMASLTQGYVANFGGSQGNLCLGGQIGGFSQNVMSSGAGGEFSLDVDTLSIPQPGGSVAIQPGETWSFQAWYRDKNPQRTSNFTDGVAILFL